MTEQSELAAWLAELEGEQAAKALVIASLRQKLGLDPSAPPSAALPAVAGQQRSHSDHVGPLRSDTFFRLSIPEAIKKYLAIVKRPQPPKAIAEALKQGGVLSQASHFYANVTTALKRLRDSGDVVNTKEGWGLAAWYPNKARTEPPPKRKRKSRAKSGPSKPAASKGVLLLGDGKPNDWPSYVAAARKDGKTMKEAAAEWKQRKESV